MKEAFEICQDALNDLICFIFSKYMFMIFVCVVLCIMCYCLCHIFHFIKLCKQRQNLSDLLNSIQHSTNVKEKTYQGYKI